MNSLLSKVGFDLGASQSPQLPNLGLTVVHNCGLYKSRRPWGALKRQLLRRLTWLSMDHFLW